MPLMPLSRAPLIFIICPFLAALLPLLLPIARNFEYEYATLTAYAVLILYGCAALLIRIKPADVSRRAGSEPLLTKRAAGASLLLAPLLASLPAFIAYKAQLCLCGEKDFWLWWLLQFGPHLLWGQLSFLVILKLRLAGRTRRFCSGLALTIVIGLLLHLIASLWLDPQKRTTQLLSGFIHGAIYDNWIPLDLGIILARAAHALIAIGLLLLLFNRQWARRALAVPFLIGALLCSQRAATYPSQTHGLDALETLMPLTREGERFTVHYRDMNSKILDARLDDLFEAVTFHMRDLSQKLLVYDTPVHIFVYPSREEKKLWFGGDGTDITDVVTPSIHINLESWPHGTLRHELVHALASSFAFHKLGFHPNLAFTEGLAVALAPEEDEISLHEGAASLVNSGRLPHPESLFSPLFWSESGRRAYTVAGSIIKFLLDRYGIAKVKQLYAGDSWAEVFNQDSSTILAEWRSFLRETYPAKTVSITAETLYRYPGIFDDVCPHTKALLLRSSDDPLITRRQPSGWDPDLSYWQWRLQLKPVDEPETHVAALQSEANRLWQNFDAQAAIELGQRVEKRRLHPPRSLEDLELFVLKIDLQIGLEQYVEARDDITAYLKFLAAFQIGDSLLRQLWVRALLLAEPVAEARPWLRLLAGVDRNVPNWDPAFKAWVIKYLFMRNTYFGSRQAELLSSFSELSVPEGLPATFAVEWQRTIGLQWMRSKNYPEAEKAFLKAAAVAPDAKRDALTLFAIEARDRYKWAH